jgi:hypothetical protein
MVQKWIWQFLSLTLVFYWQCHSRLHYVGLVINHLKCLLHNGVLVFSLYTAVENLCDYFVHCKHPYLMVFTFVRLLPLFKCLLSIHPNTMYMLLKQLCTERNKLQCFISFLIARGKLKGTSCLWLVELVFEKRYFVTVFSTMHIGRKMV